MKVGKIKSILAAVVIIIFLITPTISAQGQDLNNANKPELTIEIVIMLFLIISLMLLFFFEPISIDLIALSVPVILIALGRWTKITPEESISGFANKATITVLAMFIISAGIQQSGLI